MLTKILIAATCCSAIAACTPTQQQTLADQDKTMIGALGGAAVGAGAGTLFEGNDAKNALIGAGIGTLAGAAAGHQLDRRERTYSQPTYPYQY